MSALFWAQFTEVNAMYDVCIYVCKHICMLANLGSTCIHDLYMATYNSYEDLGFDGLRYYISEPCICLTLLKQTPCMYICMHACMQVRV